VAGQRLEKKNRPVGSQTVRGKNDLTYSAELHQSNVELRIFGVQRVGMSEGLDGLKIFLFGLL
jgi:hypothetical protein